MQRYTYISVTTPSNNINCYKLNHNELCAGRGLGRGGIVRRRVCNGCAVVANASPSANQPRVYSITVFYLEQRTLHPAPLPCSTFLLPFRCTQQNPAEKHPTSGHVMLSQNCSRIIEKPFGPTFHPALYRARPTHWFNKSFPILSPLYTPFSCAL